MIKAFKKGLVCAGVVVLGVSMFGRSADVFGQASHLFRTYKHEVPQKISETPDAVAEGKKVFEKRCW